MFLEIVDKQQAEFFAKQSELIKAMGDSFKELIARMPAINGMSYGDSPYIVDDGEYAMLLVDGSGKYSRLPPDFRLSDDSVKEDYDALYSIPALGGLIRFIPANPNYDFQAADSDSPLKSDDGFFTPVDEAFETYINGVMSLSKEYVATRLIDIMRTFVQAAGESNMTVEQFMRTPQIVGILFSIFGESLAKASERVTQIATGLDGQDDED